MKFSKKSLARQFELLGLLKIYNEDLATFLEVAFVMIAAVLLLSTIHCEKYDPGTGKVSVIPVPAGLHSAPSNLEVPEDGSPRFRAVRPQPQLLIIPKEVLCRIPFKQQINPFISQAADGHQTFDSLQFVPGVNVDGQLRSSFRVNMGANEQHARLNISLTNTVCGNVSQVYPFLTRHADGHVQLDSIGFWPQTFVNGHPSNIARFNY